MNRYLVILLPAAEANIGEAYAWIAERDEAAATRWYNQLMDVVFSLNHFPERCPLAPESKFFKTEIR